MHIVYKHNFLTILTTFQVKRIAGPKSEFYLFKDAIKKAT